MRSFYVALVGVCLGVAVASATDFTYTWGHPQPQGNPVFGIVFATETEGWAVAGGGCVLHTTDGGQHWTLQHGLVDVADDLIDVVVTPAGTLIACGDGLRRSTDGGVTWTTPAYPPAADLRDLCLVPGGGISAAGAGGVVLVSTDDGVSWSSRGPNSGTIRHHVWTSSLEGYVVGRDVQHRTIDGGAHWAPFLPAQFFGFVEVFFTDAQHGYVHEDFDVWTTENGGVTWTEHQNFINPLYRYRTLVLDAQHWLLVCHGEGGELWETADGGSTWELRQLGGNVGFPCIASTPGGRVVYGSDAGDLFWSDDLGVTIHNAAENFGGAAQGGMIDLLLRRPDGVLYAANQPTSGEVPAWLRSDDGGGTWQVPAQTPNLYWVTDGAFYDDQRGVVGRDDQTRVTADGGATWQPGGTLPATYRVVEFALPAADRWFVAAYRTGVAGGGILRSANGGQTWEPVTSGVPFGSITFWSIDFPTPTLGFAAGATASSQPALYRTTDGGATWQPVAFTGLTSIIREMAWFDALHGVATQSFPAADLRRTVDGGATWTPVSDATPYDIVVRDATTAVGVPPTGPILLLTTDAGATWQDVAPPFRGPFPNQTSYVTAGAPIDGGWVLGGALNRIIVAREDGLTATPDEPEGDAVPAGRSVLAAAPNPFNPATTLRFRTSSPGPVGLAIHDARGRRVRALLTESLPAGDHAVRWDGRDDAGRAVAAGVYLARLSSAADVPKTAKLLLAK